MDVDTCYSELGLTPDCTDAQIKAAWRRLAAHWHPDRNDSPQALRKTQRINQALDEIRKARRLGVPVGADGDEAAEEDPPPPAPPNKTSRAQAERILDHTVSVSLEEAAAGCARELRGEVVDDCVACGASGRQAEPTACKQCGGSGEFRQQLWFGWVSQSVACEACQGQGTVQSACGPCEGTGKTTPRTYRCRVRIPPGTRHGDVLHAPTEIRARDADRKETLRVRIELQPHEFFQLDDDGTIKCELPVDGFSWIANRWIEVPTPGGLQQMRLKRNHFVYRIKGRGFPARRSGTAADCIVTVVPLFPEELSGKDEALIERLIASNSGDPGTAAGARVAAWNNALQKWQARLT